MTARFSTRHIRTEHTQKKRLSIESSGRPVQQKDGGSSTSTQTSA